MVVTVVNDASGSMGRTAIAEPAEEYVVDVADVLGLAKDGLLFHSVRHRGAFDRHEARKSFSRREM